MFKVFKRKKPILPTTVFGLAFVIWGINTPFIKFGLEYLTPAALIALKFSVGSIFLFLINARNWKPIDHKLWGRIFIASICGYVITLVLTYEGIARTGGINTSLLYLLAPACVYLLSIGLLKEKFNSKLLFGLIVSFFGSLLIVLAPLIGENKTVSDLAGNVMILIAVFTSALATILIKPVLAKTSPMQVTTISFGIAAIILIIWALQKPFIVEGAVFTPKIAIAIFYNLAIATVVAYSFFNYGLKRISGEQSSILFYLDPVAGVVGSAILLQETITTPMIVGALLVIWGLYVGELHKHHHLPHLHHHR